MAKAKKNESNLLEDLLGPVDPLAYEQVRSTMMLAKKIDDARLRKGWTKVEFARQMGRNPSEVTKWLSGTHNFGTHLLIEIGMKLGIKLLNVQEEEEMHDILFMGYTGSFRTEGTITGWQGRYLQTEIGSRILFGTTTVGQQDNWNGRNGSNVN